MVCKTNLPYQIINKNFVGFCPCGDNFSQWRSSNDLSTIFVDKGINTNHVCQEHEEFMSPSTYIQHLMEESATSSSPFHQLLLLYQAYVPTT